MRSRASSSLPYGTPPIVEGECKELRRWECGMRNRNRSKNSRPRGSTPKRGGIALYPDSAHTGDRVLAELKGWTRLIGLCLWGVGGV